MASEISQITLPSGSTYKLKDETARKLISELNGYSNYLGVTSTVLTDGSNTNPIAIGTETVTAKKGDIVNYKKAEFIFSGEIWQLFGDLSGLGDLAYKSSASGTVVAAGSVTAPTFTGTAVGYTPAGSVTVGSITPSGTITAPTFTGTAGSVSVSGTASISTGNGTANYTPSGTVSAPTVTVTPKTTSVTGISDVGTLPSCTLPSMTATVSNETLTLGWSSGSFSAGKLPTKATATTVVTSATATATAPSFTGNGVDLEATFSASGDYTPSGTITAPTFTGKAVTPSATFNGTKANITATGTISKPTFTGTSVSVEVS